MTTPDLFSSRYPSSPGHKAARPETSAKAASEIRSKAATLRDLCLAMLKDSPMTADAVAMSINESVLAVRPRISELLALGKIEDSGRRGVNRSGKTAVVWRVK